MAFDSLTEKLQNVFKNLRSKGRLTEDDVKAALKEVKMALLEADVNFKVVKKFVKDVQERAVGQDVMNGLNPGQMVIKIVNEELVNLMGSETTEIKLQPGSAITVIMMAGLQGAGKTTTTAKLAGKYKLKGKKPLLVACDVYRPAAIKQLQINGEKQGVEVFSMGDKNKPADIAKAALEHARKNEKLLGAVGHQQHRGLPGPEAERGEPGGQVAEHAEQPVCPQPRHHARQFGGEQPHGAGQHVGVGQVQVHQLTADLQRRTGQRCAGGLVQQPREAAVQAGVELLPGQRHVAAVRDLLLPPLDEVQPVHPGGHGGHPAAACWLRTSWRMLPPPVFALSPPRCGRASTPRRVSVDRILLSLTVSGHPPEVPDTAHYGQL